MAAASTNTARTGFSGNLIDREPCIDVLHRSINVPAYMALLSYDVARLYGFVGAESLVSLYGPGGKHWSRWISCIL